MCSSGEVFRENAAKDGSQLISLCNKEVFWQTLLPWYNGILFNQPIELGYKHSYRTRQSLWFENIPLFKKCCGEQLHSGAHYNLLCFKMLAAFVIIYRHIFLDLTWLWLHACILCTVCTPVQKNGFAKFCEFKLSKKIVHCTNWTSSCLEETLEELYSSDIITEFQFAVYVSLLATTWGAAEVAINITDSLPKTIWWFWHQTEGNETLMTMLQASFALAHW